METLCAIIACRFYNTCRTDEIHAHVPILISHDAMAECVSTTFRAVLLGARQKEWTGGRRKREDRKSRKNGMGRRLREETEGHERRQEKHTRGETEGTGEAGWMARKRDGGSKRRKTREGEAGNDRKISRGEE